MCIRSRFPLSNTFDRRRIKLAFSDVRCVVLSLYNLDGGNSVVDAAPCSTIVDDDNIWRPSSNPPLRLRPSARAFSTSDRREMRKGRPPGCRLIAWKTDS
eukprot:scaffold275092_cov37-Tisochrysis_lutea.AAC.2